MAEKSNGKDFVLPNLRLHRLGSSNVLLHHFIYYPRVIENLYGNKPILKLNGACTLTVAILCCPVL